MTGDSHLAPVSIRILCKYSNGITRRCYARAVACGTTSLSVLSSEAFEEGVRLHVLAPFLASMASYRVAKSTRSKRYPSLFELQLIFLHEQILDLVRNEEITGKTISGDPDDDLKNMVVAAANLADRIEQSGGIGLLPARQELPRFQRRLQLVAYIAATLLLLQEKVNFDIRHFLRFARENRNGSGKQNFG